MEVGGGQVRRQVAIVPGGARGVACPTPIGDARRHRGGRAVLGRRPRALRAAGQPTCRHQPPGAVPVCRRMGADRRRGARALGRAGGVDPRAHRQGGGDRAGVPRRAPEGGGRRAHDEWTSDLTITYPKHELFAEAQRRGTPCTPVNTVADLADDRHWRPAASGWTSRTLRSAPSACRGRRTGCRPSPWRTGAAQGSVSTTPIPTCVAGPRRCRRVTAPPTLSVADGRRVACRDRRGADSD